MFINFFATVLCALAAVVCGYGGETFILFNRNHNGSYKFAICD